MISSGASERKRARTLEPVLFLWRFTGGRPAVCSSKTQEVRGIAVAVRVVSCEILTCPPTRRPAALVCLKEPPSHSHPHHVFPPLPLVSVVVVYVVAAARNSLPFKLGRGKRNRQSRPTPSSCRRLQKPGRALLTSATSDERGAHTHVNPPT